MKIKPNLNDTYLTKKIGINENFKNKTRCYRRKTCYIVPYDQEIVTMMTINDYPKYLGIGYLLNQNMINKKTKIESIEYHSDLSTIVVRTAKSTNYENRLKKTVTSGCTRHIIW